MSQTCRQVVTRALRWLNITGVGNRTPSAEQAQDGLADLQALYFDLIEKGCTLQPVTVTGAYTAGENQRIYGVTAGVPVITFPSSYSTQLNTARFNTVTGTTVTNATRPPTDFAVIAIAGATPITKVYDAALASWVAIESLTLDTAAPWSTYLGQALSAMLATVIGEPYGVEVTPVCTALGKEGYDRALARLASSGPDEGSLFFMPERMRR